MIRNLLAYIWPEAGSHSAHPPPQVEPTPNLDSAELPLPHIAFSAHFPKMTLQPSASPPARI